MLRRFYINMTQKGNLQDINRRMEDIKLTFIKTNKKQVEIVEFDDEQVKICFDIENNYNTCFLSRCFGIGNNDIYKYIRESEEIRANDKEGYKQVNIKAVERETEKAYMIYDTWIAKSQTIREENTLYIKDWLFFKSFR